MKLYSTLLIILALAFSQEVGARIQTDSNADAKTAQKELLKHLKEARNLSNIAMKPNFVNARKEIDAAMSNSQYGNNKIAVLFEAGNVEYNCYDYERNKPASGSKIDYNVLYSATENGFDYYLCAYDKYLNDDNRKAFSSGTVTAMQKKAWSLFTLTEGFRANAAYYFDKKEFQASHKCFDLFLTAVESKLLNDYAKTNNRINNVLNQFKGDSVVAHARYFRAISAIKMEDTELAIAELEEILYDGFEQNVVLQELCRIYTENDDEENLIRVLKEGIKLQPNEPWYSRNMVNIYLDHKDYDKAGQVINQLIKVDSNNPANLSLKGQLVELQGQLDEALQYYEKSYMLDSMTVEINSHIGRVWYNRATEIEKALFEKRLYQSAESASLPVYTHALDYYLKAFYLDENHYDKTIANAIRTILYKQFTKADCPNKTELIDKYNEVSRAYKMKEFPR